jgi:hypothetical protein
MEAFKEEERKTIEERGWRNGERRLGISKQNYGIEEEIVKVKKENDTVKMRRNAKVKGRGQKE